MQRCLRFPLNLMAGCCAAMVLLLTAAVPVTHAQPPAQIRVGYIVTAARISAEDQAAIDWLTANRRFRVSVSYASRPSWKLPVCDVVWLHCPDAGEYRAMHARPAFMQALRTALARSGKIVATDYAAFLPADLGIEPVRPVVRYDTLQNDWLWDKKGYNSFRGHPLFNGLFGGDYVWDATVDQILPIVGYFGDVWPARGRVVAVEKSYVFLHAERKIAIEHNAGTGRILSLGGMIYFSKENHLRGNLEQFMENALLYAAGVHLAEPVTFWEPAGANPVESRFTSRPLVRASLHTLDSPRAGDLLLKQDSAGTEMFDLAGRRALIMGKERGGIDEVWVHPIRILRDYEAGIVSGDTVLWLSTLSPGIEVRPASFTRRYVVGPLTLTETLFPSLGRAGGVARYSCDRPVRLVIRFRSDLRWMWPYDSRALGALTYGMDAGLQALHVSDRSGDFACLFGADQPPRTVLAGHFSRVTWAGGVLAGTPTGDMEVAFGAEYEVGSQGRESLTFAFAGTNEGSVVCEGDYRELAGDPVAVHRALADHYRSLLARSVGITSPDTEFNALYQWAIVGTDRFVACTPGVGTGLLAGFGTVARGWDGAQKISGRPGYAWYFGRDAAWSCFAIDDYGDLATVKQQLELYQSLQDRTGKIFHELSTSGVVHFDASDATPMYVMLAEHYLRASGDTAFIRARWPHIRKAMEFLFSTDTDGDGLIENTDVGHGWVEPGGELFGTHSEYYLSVLWTKALEGAAAMAGLVNDTGLRDRYSKHAERVRRILNTDFWNPSTRFFSHGKMKDGSFAAEHTAFPAVGLIWGMVDDDKAPYLLREYASSDFSTDWGVRGLSGASKFFKPRSYQEGAAWPLFTGWTALGEFAYGNSVQGFTHIRELMAIKNFWALGFVEEVMNGAVFRPSGVCFHQCWSETNILHPVIEGLVGWKPDALSMSASLSPRFPANWDSVRVDRLRSGATLLSLTMTRLPGRTVYTIQRDAGPPCAVTFTPEILPGMTVDRVLIDSVAYSWSPDTERGILKKAIHAEVTGQVTITLEQNGGIAMLPVIPHPLPGDSTRWHRLLASGWNNGALVVEVEGRGGTTGVFPFRVFGQGTPVASGAEIRRSIRPGEWELHVVFDLSGTAFTTKTLAVSLR